MEPRFYATTVLNKEAYRNRVTVDYIIHQKPPAAVFYAVTLALAGFLWCGAAMNADRSASFLPMLLYGAVLLGIAILGAPYLDSFSVKRVSSRILKTTLKNVKDLGVTSTLTFLEQGLVLETPTAHAERSYGEITNLCETYDYFLLFEGKDYCFTVAKSGLEGGTAADFTAFLEAACGTKCKPCPF